MRASFLAVFLIAFIQSALPQTRAAEDEKPARLAVRISEFELESPSGHRIGNAEILAYFTDTANKDDVVELQTLRLTVLEGSDSMVQFGRRVSITTGRMVSGRGIETRQTQFVDVGTMLRISGQLKDSECTVAISYEGSRLVGSDTDESPSDVITTQLSGTFTATIGEPLLLGGINSENTSFLVLTVERQD